MQESLERQETQSKVTHLMAHGGEQNLLFFYNFDSFLFVCDLWALLQVQDVKNLMMSKEVQTQADAEVKTTWSNIFVWYPFEPCQDTYFITKICIQFM